MMIIKNKKKNISDYRFYMLSFYCTIDVGDRFLAEYSGASILLHNENRRDSNGPLALSLLTFNINVFVGGLRLGSKQVIHPLYPSLLYTQTGMQLSYRYTLCSVTSLLTFSLSLPLILPIPFLALLRPSHFVKCERTRYTASWLSLQACNIIVSTSKRGKGRKKSIGERYSS